MDAPSGSRAGSLDRDALIVGAGVSGLSCARELVCAGWGVTVLEKSRGVGGRCATRRMHGQPVDHGVLFLHGSDAGFIADLDAASPATRIEPWPARVAGVGRPCLPRAFGPRERRVAWREGVTVFAKHLSAGLDVRLETTVEGVRAERSGFVVEDAGGVRWRTRCVVLTAPGPQVAAMLGNAGESLAVRSARAVTEMCATSACLSVIAAYAGDSPEPGWDVLYPEHSSVLHLVSHESAKRPGADRRILVFQALPSWSRRWLDRPVDEWTGAIVREAGTVVGPWAASPTEVHSHRWRFARSSGVEMTAPLLLRDRDHGIMAITGESFAPGGGVEGAWVAGRELARRLVSGA